MERAWRTVLALLAAYAAPLLLFGQKLAKERPALAFWLALAWLAVVTVAWAFWRVAAEPINRRFGRWSASLDRIVDQRFSRYGKFYGQWVLDSRRYLDAKGLATVGTFSPELDEVFVDVGLTARAPSQVPPGLLGSEEADTGRRQSIWEFLDQDGPLVLAVIGAPGSGKTTLLNHVARRTARTAQDRRRAIPVLLQLRDHAKTVAADQSISLPALIRQAVPGLAIPEPFGWWESRLIKGKCVVLLDGLDEVASSDERRDIVGWVNQQIALFPRNDFVVTSRPHGYRDSFIESASTLQVLSFTPDQVRRFLHGWYLAVERRATGAVGREVEMLASEAADDLLDRLAATPALYDLTINPLLLTMIANVHRFRRSLPSSRADLYGEVCQVMLWRRQEAKRMDLNLPGVSKERLLSWLAYGMMCSGTRDIGVRQILDGIRPRLKRISADVTPEEFLNDVGSNGLIVERERDLFAFAHLTFQEFLAARHIRENGLERVLVEAVENPWWRETTLLYLAGADADNIVRAAIRSGGPVGLSLAFECAEVGAELAPELRQRLAEVMRSAFGADASPESRRIVGGVLASRHLRTLVPVASGARVCPDPVTADLYLLFRKETGTPAPDQGQVIGQRSPARGMWSCDATAFIRWINSLASANGTGGSQGVGLLYRLPDSAELDELAGGSGPAGQILASQARCVWKSSDGQRRPSVWTTPGSVPVNVVQVAELFKAAVSDLSRSGLLAKLISVTAMVMSERITPIVGPILEDSEALARGMENLRSGRDAGNLENSTTLEDLHRNLTAAREAATALDRALRRISSITREDAIPIERMLAGQSIRRAVAYLETAASLGRDVAIAQEWNRDLGVDGVLPDARATRDRLARARERLSELADNEGVAVPRISLLEKRLCVDSGRLGFVGSEQAAGKSRVTIGACLSLAVVAVLEPRDAEDRRNLAERFTNTLFHISSKMTPDPISVDLGALAEFVHRLPDTATRGFSSPTWAMLVLRRLREAASPILSRQQPLSEDSAVAIRVPALVLAAEAVSANQPALAADLRSLAAATCLLRRRAAAGASLETLVLATT